MKAVTLRSWISLALWRFSFATMAMKSEDELRKMSKDDLIRYTLELQLRNGKNESGPREKRRRGKEVRPFEMAKYSERMIALRIAYLGWNFNGFAEQPALSNTIEEHLFSALVRTRLIESRATSSYSRAGRTDKGVSALDQVVGLRVRSIVKEEKDEEMDYVRMLNRTLPAGIRVLGWAPAPEQGESGRDRPFTARFDAQSRTYRYYFVIGSMNVTAMKEAAEFFVGDHDFRNFCKIDAVNVHNFRRVLYEVDIRPCQQPNEREPDSSNDPTSLWFIHVRGQAFLWHQIRCMAAILFDVGSRREKPEIVKRMLYSNGDLFSGKPSYQMAPATPLVLFSCQYPPALLDFRCSQRACRELDRDVVETWAELMAKTGIAENLLHIGPDRSVRGGSILSPARPVRSSASLVIHLLRGSLHTPLEKRAREPPLEEKLEAASAKRRAKEEEDACD